MRFAMTYEKTSPFSVIHKPLRKNHYPLTLCDVDNCTDEATQKHTFTARKYTQFGLTTDGEKAYMYTCAGHSWKAQDLADDYAKKWLS